MQNIKEAFGSNVRKIRKSKKLTLETFSEILDITPRQLGKIESGETFLSAETLCKISVALDVSLKALFDFEWDDKLMYYDKGKYVKSHFKVIKNGEISSVKSLPALKAYTINTTIPTELIKPYFIDFAKKSKLDIFVDVFLNKEREKIIKFASDGNYYLLAQNTELKHKKKQIKDDNYYYVLEKIREFSVDKTKIEYVKASVDALSNKRALSKLKTMIKGIEISQ